MVDDKPTIPGSLGYHYDLCKAIFGESSEATLWLEEQVYAKGRDEMVLCHESQLIALLGYLHNKGDRKVMPPITKEKSNG